MPSSAFAFPPCRSHDLHWPLEEYPERLKRNPATEVYWFNWRADGSLRETTIRVARVDNDVVATRLHRGSMFGKVRILNGRLTMADWARLEDAVVAAGFWLLDEDWPNLGSMGGAHWMIAGRRRHDYHLVKRLNPRGELYDFGRLMFDLVGLDGVRL
jgi:hypothetical protein